MTVAGPDRLSVLFIGGMGRSGSTLLERLIGDLPGAFAMGEVVHLWQRGIVDAERCGCGKSFAGCAFWLRVGEIGFGGWDRFDTEGFFALKASVDRTRFIPKLARGRLGSDLRTRADRHNAIYHRLYEAVRQVSGCSVLIDSSKSASLAHCLRWCPDVDLKVLQVVRDPRAVAHSWSKVVRRPEAAGGSAEGEYMARWSPAKTAMHWDAQNLGFDLLVRAGVPRLRVRYEDFAAAPAPTLREIARFAGLDASSLPFINDSTVELRGNHQVAGNPMRFRAGPVELRADEVWRSQFGRASRMMVTAMTMPILVRYGYSWRSSRTTSMSP